MSTLEGAGVSGDLLSNSQDLTSTGVYISAFKLGSSPTTYSANWAALTVVAADGATVTGTLYVNSTGVWAFYPAGRFFGEVPVVTYTVRANNGETDKSTLTISVIPGECCTPRWALGRIGVRVWGAFGWSGVHEWFWG